MATPKVSKSAKQNRPKDLSKEIRRYTLTEKQSMPVRIADCLNWCADECPKQFVALNLLTRAIMGYGYTPNANSKEVQGMRKRFTRVRQILLKSFERDLKVERGVGVRATYDSEDVAVTTLGDKIRRMEGARKSIESTIAIIDPSKIINKSTKQFVIGVSTAFKALSSAEIMGKLLVKEAQKKKETE